MLKYVWNPNMLYLLIPKILCLIVYFRYYHQACLLMDGCLFVLEIVNCLYNLLVPMIITMLSKMSRFSTCIWRYLVCCGFVAYCFSLYETCMFFFIWLELLRYHQLIFAYDCVEFFCSMGFCVQWLKSVENYWWICLRYMVHIP